METTEPTEYESFSVVARDHATRPRNLGPLNFYNGHYRLTGPCGDTMEFWVNVQNRKVADAGFVTDGCGSSLACGSIATVLVKGEPLEQALALTAQDILGALAGLPQELEHCAYLASDTLRKACENYQKNAPPEEEQTPGEDALQRTLAKIRHKVAVFSGKGGVGKSTVAVNLATALTLAGKKVGLLDTDIHGPSIPTMLGCERYPLDIGTDGLKPVELDGLKVMSLGFLLNSQDDAVIWRGPRKMSVIKQFLEDVEWGELDYLIIDSPPGTGDEPLSICQLIGELDGAVIVTTPQKVAAVDVRKSISFCRQLQVPVIGVVENMSGYVCPKCGDVNHILPPGGGAKIAADMNVPLLGSIPMDPQIALAGDSGTPYLQQFAETRTAAVMRQLIEPLLAEEEGGSGNRNLSA